MRLDNDDVTFQACLRNDSALLLLAVAVEFHAGDAREFCDATAVPFSQALKPSLDRMTKDIVVAVLGPVETNGVRK